MKKYIAVTILSLAVVIPSICAWDFDLTEEIIEQQTVENINVTV